MHNGAYVSGCGLQNVVRSSPDLYGWYNEKDKEWFEPHNQFEEICQ
jgi:hypothetical protein